MYIILYGNNNYKKFMKRNDAIRFCKEVGVSWIDNV